MNISISCPNPKCGASFNVPADDPGRRGRCPECGTFVDSTGETESNAPVRGHAIESHAIARLRQPPTELPERFGRFRILGRLGRGGMGSVYKAFDTNLQRHVALKVPHLGPNDGPAVVERFYREARIAATFDHTNLCPVYIVDQVEGVHYLTMPLFDGQPLSKCFDGQHPLPQRPVAALVRMLALAMEEAHHRGVVHRDLKPSNIMADRNRTLVIVDFGLSLRSGWVDRGCQGSHQPAGDPRITRAGSILGTPAYMAPEQVSGETGAIGPACDIYSLGVILYELLTEHLPFEGPTPVVLGLIQVSEPPRASSYRTDLEPGLEAICMKAMAKLPGARFASMGEFAASLKMFLDQGDRNAAGVTVAALLKPPLQEADAPTLKEQQLVERLLAGTAHELDGRLPKRRAWVPRFPRSRRWIVTIAAVGAAMCLFGAQYLFAPRGAAPMPGGFSQIAQISPQGNPGSAPQVPGVHEVSAQRAAVAKDAAPRPAVPGSITPTLPSVTPGSAPPASNGHEHAENGVVNGSFEMGPPVRDFLPLDIGSTAIAGWQVTRGQIDYLENHWKDADGKRSLDLHGSPGHGGVQQTFKTTKGKRYRVTFSLAGSPGCQFPVKRVAVDAAGAGQDFSFDSTGKTSANMGWVTKEWEFDAIDDYTTLEIYTLENTDPVAGPAIDNVRVQEVPRKKE